MTVIERELQCPVDIIVDERNGIVVLAMSFFSGLFAYLTNTCNTLCMVESNRSRSADAGSMKSLTYNLATSQIQFHQLWIIIGTVWKLRST